MPVLDFPSAHIDNKAASELPSIAVFPSKNLHSGAHIWP